MSRDSSPVLEVRVFRALFHYAGSFWCEDTRVPGKALRQAVSPVVIFDVSEEELFFS